MIQNPPIAGLISLRGRVCVVTGAAQGFGFAIARRFAEAGAVIHLVDHQRADMAAEQLAEIGDTVSHRLDITSEPEVRALFASLPREVPWVLVNNAGVFSNSLVENLSMAEFQRVLGVNVAGTFLMTREFVRACGVPSASSVINIASVDGLHPSCSGLAHYTTSKHAVVGLTRSLAMELAPRGIRVNAICPGAAMTEGAVALIQTGSEDGVDIAAQWAGITARTPLGRLIEADDVARAALFLASDLSANVTAISLPVDGGILMQPLEGYVDEGGQS